VQEHCQDHAHGHHLHQAARQRQGGFALYMDRKPAA
jgi:hypothetical protein